MGWTWEYIDENMTLPRLDALNRHWSIVPPADMLIAAYMEHKPPADLVPQQQAKQQGTMEDMMRLAGEMGIVVTKEPLEVMR